MKERYERSELVVIRLGKEDVIAASDPVKLSFRRDEYEGHVMRGQRA